MIGGILTEIRQRIESLAADDGDYYVVCARTGLRPAPVAGERFSDRDAAAEAAELATAYRAVLRRYDPRAPWYDFVACEDVAALARDRRTTAREAGASTTGPGSAP